MTQRIMTFNIRVSTSEDKVNDWPYRKQRVSKVIDKYSPFIVGTQEGTYPMLCDLMEELENYDYVGEGRLGDTVDEYCAIFYDRNKVKVIDSNTFWLSESPDVKGSKSWNTACPRICTWAHFQFKNTNKELLVFNIHLDHMSEEARARGISLVISKWKEINAGNDLPTVLMGDFNSEPDSGVVRFLNRLKETNGEKCYLIDAYSVVEEIGCTYHDFTGEFSGEPIDYIYVSPNVEIQHTEIIRDSVNGQFPSDHYPLLTEVSIP